MGSSSNAAVPPASPEFLGVFCAEAGPTGAMTFARFMALALYHPDVGYYRRDRARVGYAPGTDFFTASSSGPVFGELVAAACVTRLGPGRDPQAHTFVEIGAEPGRGVLTGVDHPFARVQTVRLGEPLRLSGSCVVFSNELFDAQPLTRTVWRDGRWRELGVSLKGGQLVEVELSTPPPPDAAAAPPPSEGDGYVFDQPLAAANLAETIAREPWKGLFVAFDYGKSLRELTESCPAGTARAYHRHTQSNDLLAQPGEQDLTGHVCWDWIAAALARQGFASPQVDSQEGFFIRHSAAYIAAATSADAGRFSQRKLSLMQLLHPAHLGQKFQVLHALR